jgi:hypothetical protein
MGGKRPDQHNIDPAEGMSTDKKWGIGHEDEHLKDADKERYIASQKKDPPMIPEAGVNPALRDLRERKMEGQATAANLTKEERQEQGLDEPKTDA